ncbi:lipid-A-disaccharide synthase [Rhodopila sp.]|uniref:lipid-A-disaccharide synthase n=1 Tax=Rhodopila sp. TaxID=2480087 RepID=UPI003D0BF5F3
MTLIYLIAGEQSGDVLGARLMAALKARRPEFGFAGIGGAAMAAQGLDSLFPIRSLALMGLLEVVPKLFELRTLLRRTVADIEQRRPDVVVTIDSPGFTLRVLGALRRSGLGQSGLGKSGLGQSGLGQSGPGQSGAGQSGPGQSGPGRSGLGRSGLKRAGLKRAHFVAPQVWAWRENRVKHYPGLWDELLCLLPFEPEFFAGHGLPARFVGHPVLESGAETGDAARFRARHAVPPDARVLTIMPGSRRTEVSRLLPILEATLRLLPDRVEGVGSVVPVVPLAGPVEDMVRELTSGWPVRPILVADDAAKHDAFAASAVALTKSGTSTLELALANVPMLVTYRVNPVTHLMARRMIRVRYASLLNLLLDRPVVPELLQYDGRPDRLAAELGRLLSDPDAVALQRRGFAEALALLRPPFGTPSECAAEAVLALLPPR